jgi:hypothetical protein
MWLQVHVASPTSPAHPAGFSDIMKKSFSAIRYGGRVGLQPGKAVAQVAAVKITGNEGSA